MAVRAYLLVLTPKASNKAYQSNTYFGVLQLVLETKRESPLNLRDTKALPNGSSIANYAVLDASGGVVHESKIYRSSQGNVLKITHCKPGGTEQYLSSNVIWPGSRRDHSAVVSMSEQPYVWTDVKLLSPNSAPPKKKKPLGAYRN